MKILVTGSGGFIGRNICELLQEEYDIVSPKHSELDLTNQKDVQEYLLSERFDVVIHAASSNQVKHPSIVGHVIEHDLRMFSNLTADTSLYGRLIYFGSGAEYDSKSYIPHMKEDYLGRNIPDDEYGYAKYINACLTEHATNIYELCLFGVFGKYEEWQRRFISNVIYQFLNKEIIRINYHAMYDYLYITDLIKVLKWFIDLNNHPKYQRYNVCTGKSEDLFQIARIVRNCIGINKEILIKNDSWGKEYSGDNKRLLDEIGPVSFTEYKDAINELIDYYKYNGFV